jgi:Fe-S-cluster-containing dehydrogenase component
MEQSNNKQTTNSSDVSRREFIRTTAAGFVALGAIGVAGVDFLKSPVSPIDRDSSGVIFPDPTLCIGCLTCEVACTEAHKEVGLAAIARIRIFNEPATKVDPEITKNYPGRGNFLQHVCMQCPDAPCLPVCPVNALHVDAKTGARVIDEKTCIACGRCAASCPFDVRSETAATNQTVFGQKTRITYEPKTNVYTKCDLCSFRPEGPACVQKCPINIRIKQGIVKVEEGRMCLSLPKSDKATWSKLRDMQIVKKA